MSYIGRSLGQGVRNRFIYTATAGQTTFSGSDDNGSTLVYTDGTYVDVNLNGVELVSGTDYTATSGTSIVLTTGASLNDILSITVYDVFAVADTVSAQNGGTFSGDVNVNGDLAVDTNTLFVDASTNNVGIGTSSPSAPLHINGGGAGSLIIDGTDSIRPSTDDSLITISGGDATNSGANYSLFGGTHATLSNIHRWRVGGSEAMRIDSSGYFLVNRNASTGSVRHELGFAPSSEIAIRYHMTDTTYNNALMEFIRSDGNRVGYIYSNASSTAYITSSDYRLKENVTPLDNASDRLKQIPVHRFNFIADPDTTVDGFLAHEVQAIVPEAIHGTKDGVDDEGNPEYQGIDQSKLVPLLTAALQEALTKIEDLEARVTALETP